MRVAHPERHHVARHVRRALVDQPGQRRRHQVDLDVLPLPGGLAMAQRGQHADHRVVARHHVEHGDPGPVGRPVRLAGQAHQPRHGLHHQIVARHPRAGPRPEPADRGVDDAGVGRADGVVVEPVLGQPAGAEVLHQHVGPPGQLPGEPGVALLPQVERDRPLAPVDAQVIGGRRAARGRRPGAGVVPAGALDLDDVGAQIRQQHRGVRAGQHPGEVGHQHTGQWPLGHVVSHPDPFFRSLSSSVRSTDVCPLERSQH